jgi:hypothetical protein
MTERMPEGGPQGGRTLAGDLGPDETVGGGPFGEHPIDRGGGTGAGVSAKTPKGGPDLPDHADEPELLGGPGDGLSAERRSRA